MKIRHFLFALPFIGCSALLSAADKLSDAEAARILERVARAPLQTAFHGVYVQQHGDYLETIRICRVIDNGVILERREALDGSPREMVRHGDQISLYVPEGSRSNSFDPHSISGRMFPRLLPDNPSELLSNYILHRTARERIAGVDADVFELEPRDRLRYPYRIWVHAESGLLLKSAALGFKRETLDLYAFSQLALGAQVDRNLLKPVNPVKPVAVDAGTQSTNTAWLWEAKSTPSGFRLIQQRTVPGRGQKVIQHVYSDGIATVSVFLEPMQNGLPLGSGKQGALSIFGRQDAAYHIMVLGKVPPETVELFAKAYKVLEKQGKK